MFPTPNDNARDLSSISEEQSFEIEMKRGKLSDEEAVLPVSLGDLTPIKSVGTDEQLPLDFDDPNFNSEQPPSKPTIVCSSPGAISTAKIRTSRESKRLAKLLSVLKRLKEDEPEYTFVLGSDKK